MSGIGSKKVVGLVEVVKVIGEKGEVRKKALLDTGATHTSVDLGIAAKAGLGPVVASTKIKSKTSIKGYVRRAVVLGEIELRGKRVKVKLNLEDRQGMTHKILVGRDVLHSNFLVDVEKTHQSHNLVDEKKRTEISEKVLSDD